MHNTTRTTPVSSVRVSAVFHHSLFIIVCEVTLDTETPLNTNHHHSCLPFRYVVSVNSKSVTSTFSPNDKGLSNPHDVAVSHDGTAVYVVELSPRKLWKFDVGEYRWALGMRLSAC